MIQISVNNAERIEELFKNAPIEAKKILWRAVNRAATAGRTRASVSIRKTYVIKAGDVKKSIKIRRASSSNITANLRASGPTLPLMNFRVSPSFPDVMRVRASVKKGGMKPIDKAFVTRTSNGFVNAFVREGDARYPIKSLYGPSIAQMLGNENVLDTVLLRTKEVLDERTKHELDRYFKGGL